MIKRLLVLLLIIAGIYFLFSFLKSSLGFQDFFYEQSRRIINIPKKRIDSFIEEKKEVIVEEIDSEKESIKESIKDTIKETGKSIWNNIGDFIFKEEESFDTDIDTEG